MMDTGPDTEISFECPKCGGPASAWIKEPNTDYEEGDGDGFQQDVSCLDPRCRAKWVINMYATHNRVHYSLMDHSDVLVSDRPLNTDHDRFDDPLPEPGAYGIFLSALDELRTITGKMGIAEGDSTVNRMLFVHLYSIIEAYLSDIITGIAMADTTIQLKLLNHVDALKTKKLTLEEFLKQPTAVVDHIRANLAKTSFHNLESVDKICAATIKHSIFPADANDRTFLEASVDKRHDCVHRNGLTHAGQLHADITPDYILRLAKLFEDIAQNLEDRLTGLKVERFFKTSMPDLGAGERMVENV